MYGSYRKILEIYLIRPAKFRDQILTIDPNLENVPRGFKRLGNYIILRSEVELSDDLGKAAMQSYSWCEGVFQHLTTIGENREPVLRHLFGSSETEIVHIENGTKFVLDINRIMLSGGNTKLRRELAQEVKNGENLLDMFCAIGNLSMQVLVHRRVSAILIEKNPYTYSYLLKTLEKNKILSVKTHNIDCRDLSLELWADRIFMGYHDIDVSHLKVALKAAKKKSILHMHPIARKDDYNEVVSKYKKLITELGVTISQTQVEKVKDYAPNLHHIQVIFSIEK